jgi:hypothetical protein
MTIKHNLLTTCCLCGQKFTGYGNSAYPLVEEGYCCSKCNREKVIPERIKLAMHHGALE